MLKIKIAMGDDIFFDSSKNDAVLENLVSAIPEGKKTKELLSELSGDIFFLVQDLKKDFTTSKSIEEYIKNNKDSFEEKEEVSEPSPIEEDIEFSEDEEETSDVEFSEEDDEFEVDKKLIIDAILSKREHILSIIGNSDLSQTISDYKLNISDFINQIFQFVTNINYYELTGSGQKNIKNLLEKFFNEQIESISKKETALPIEPASNQERQIEPTPQKEKQKLKNFVNSVTKLVVTDIFDRDMAFLRTLTSDNFNSLLRKNELDFDSISKYATDTESVSKYSQEIYSNFMKIAEKMNLSKYAHLCTYQNKNIYESLAKIISDSFISLIDSFLKNSRGEFISKASELKDELKSIVFIYTVVLHERKNSKKTQEDTQISKEFYLKTLSSFKLSYKNVYVLEGIANSNLKSEIEIEKQKEENEISKVLNPDKDDKLAVDIKDSIVKTSLTTKEIVDLIESDRGSDPSEIISELSRELSDKNSFISEINEKLKDKNLTDDDVAVLNDIKQETEQEIKELNVKINEIKKKKILDRKSKESKLQVSVIHIDKNSSYPEYIELNAFNPIKYINIDDTGVASIDDVKKLTEAYNASLVTLRRSIKAAIFNQSKQISNVFDPKFGLATDTTEKGIIKLSNSISKNVTYEISGFLNDLMISIKTYDSLHILRYTKEYISNIFKSANKNISDDSLNNIANTIYELHKAKKYKLSDICSEQFFIEYVAQLASLINSPTVYKFITIGINEEHLKNKYKAMYNRTSSLSEEDSNAISVIEANFANQVYNTVDKKITNFINSDQLNGNFIKELTLSSEFIIKSIVTKNSELSKEYTNYKCPVCSKMLKTSTSNIDLVRLPLVPAFEEVSYDEVTRKQNRDIKFLTNSDFNSYGGFKILSPKELDDKLELLSSFDLKSNSYRKYNARMKRLYKENYAKLLKTMKTSSEERTWKQINEMCLSSDPIVINEGLMRKDHALLSLMTKPGITRIIVANDSYSESAFKCPSEDEGGCGLVPSISDDIPDFDNLSTEDFIDSAIQYSSANQTIPFGKLNDRIERENYNNSIRASRTLSEEETLSLFDSINSQSLTDLNNKVRQKIKQATAPGFKFSKNSLSCPISIVDSEKALSGEDFEIFNRSIFYIPKTALINSTCYPPLSIDKYDNGADGFSGYIPCLANVSVSRIIKNKAHKNSVQSVMLKLFSSKEDSTLKVKFLSALISFGLQIQEVMSFYESIQSSIEYNSLPATGNLSDYIFELGFYCQHGHTFTFKQANGQLDKFKPIKFGNKDLIKSTMQSIGFYAASGAGNEKYLKPSNPIAIGTKYNPLNMDDYLEYEGNKSPFLYSGIEADFGGEKITILATSIDISGKSSYFECLKYVGNKISENREILTKPLASLSNYEVKLKYIQKFQKKTYDEEGNVVDTVSGDIAQGTGIEFGEVTKYEAFNTIIGFDNKNFFESIKKFKQIESNPEPIPGTSSIKSFKSQELEDLRKVEQIVSTKATNISKGLNTLIKSIKTVSKHISSEQVAKMFLAEKKDYINEKAFIGLKTEVYEASSALANYIATKNSIPLRKTEDGYVTFSVDKVENNGVVSYIVKDPKARNQLISSFEGIIKKNRALYTIVDSTMNSLIKHFIANPELIDTNPKDLTVGILKIIIKKVMEYIAAEVENMLTSFRVSEQVVTFKSSSNKDKIHASTGTLTLEQVRPTKEDYESIVSEFLSARPASSLISKDVSMTYGQAMKRRLEADSAVFMGIMESGKDAMKKSNYSIVSRMNYVATCFYLIDSIKSLLDKYNTNLSPYYVGFELGIDNNLFSDYESIMGSISEDGSWNEININSILISNVEKNISAKNIDKVLSFSIKSNDIQSGDIELSSDLKALIVSSKRLDLMWNELSLIIDESKNRVTSGKYLAEARKYISDKLHHFSIENGLDDGIRDISKKVFDSIISESTLKFSAGQMFSSLRGTPYFLLPSYGTVEVVEMGKKKKVENTILMQQGTTVDKKYYVYHKESLKNILFDSLDNATDFCQKSGIDEKLIRDIDHIKNEELGFDNSKFQLTTFGTNPYINGGANQIWPPVQFVNAETFSVAEITSDFDKSIPVPLYGFSTGDSDDGSMGIILPVDFESKNLQHLVKDLQISDFKLNVIFENEELDISFLFKRGSTKNEISNARQLAINVLPKYTKFNEKKKEILILSKDQADAAAKIKKLEDNLIFELKSVSKAINSLPFRITNKQAIDVYKNVEENRLLKVCLEDPYWCMFIIENCYIYGVKLTDDQKSKYKRFVEYIYKIDELKSILNMDDVFGNVSERNNQMLSFATSDEWKSNSQMKERYRKWWSGPKRALDVSETSTIKYLSYEDDTSPEKTVISGGPATIIPLTAKDTVTLFPSARGLKDKSHGQASEEEIRSVFSSNIMKLVRSSMTGDDEEIERVKKSLILRDYDSFIKLSNKYENDESILSILLHGLE